MKRTLLLTLLVLCIASLALAQPDPGNIGVFADAAGSNCNITDVAGLVIAHVVHVNAVSAASSQWAIVKDPTVNLTYVAFTAKVGLPLGDPNTGLALSYVSCKSVFPLELIEITYFGSGTTSSCGKISVVASPVAGSGEIEVVSCGLELLTIGAVGGSAMVNTTGTCGCDIATEETSWSRIKALYQ